jgi:hypothetical protein
MAKGRQAEESGVPQMRRLNNRRTILVGGGLLLAATATAALAGNGVGGVFNLGEVNTVNSRTDLQGTTSTQSLRALNTSTATGSAAVWGQANGGSGVVGSSTSRMGVRALATNTSGVNYGIYATTASRGGYAGYFQNTGTTTNPQLGRGIRSLAAGASASLFNPEDGAAGGEFAGPNGVIGVASHPAGAGVAGHAGTGQYGVFGSGRYGVFGVSPSVGGFFRNTDDGTAVVGLSNGANQNDDTVWAFATGEFFGSIGVKGYSNEPGGGIGVLALQGSGRYAFQAVGASSIAGTLDVQGHLTKGSGTFKIDHPLDPANKYLSHSFVESPDMMNIYNGNVVTDADGMAAVELPDYFGTLNRDPRYQLTVMGVMAQAIIEREIEDNEFTIRTSEPNVKVSWQVTGIRQDAYAEAHPIVVEEDKALADRGHYLHPVEHGQPATMGIGTHVAAQAGAEEPSVR